MRMNKEYRDSRIGKRESDRRTNPGVNLSQAAYEKGLKLLKEGGDVKSINSTAHKLMKGWVPLYEVLTGARLYEKIGKGKMAATFLERTLNKRERSYQGTWAKGYWEQELKDEGKDIQDFIYRNLGRGPASPVNRNSLASKVTAFSVIAFVGIVLGVSSMNATGSVISLSSGNAGGLSGIFFFLAGVTGIFLSVRRK